MTREQRAAILSYSVLAIAGFVSLFPILWIIGISLKTQADAFAMPPKLVFVPIWDHYVKVWGDATFIKGFSTVFLPPSSALSLHSPSAFPPPLR